MYVAFAIFVLMLNAVYLDPWYPITRSVYHGQARLTSTALSDAATYCGERFGVLINNASQNYVGSDAAGNVFANVIAANSSSGVSICGGAEPTLGVFSSCNNGSVEVWQNKVLGNYIGTNQAGAHLGNSQQGIDLGGGVSLGCPSGAQNCVVGTEVGANVIENNATGGILNSYAAGSTIHDNTALYNGGPTIPDLDEENPAPACGNDTWVNNTFQKKGGAGASCIGASL
jgi:hypothetical protein